MSKITISCPKCDDELTFDVSSDWQGDGCWGMNVETVSLEAQNCQCSFTQDDLDELNERASMAAGEAESDWLNDRWRDD